MRNTIASNITANNMRGLSLVEVLVSLGIVGVLLLAILSMMQSQFRGANTTRAVIASSEFISEITKALGNKDTCSTLLNNQRLSSENIVLDLPSGLLDATDSTRNMYGRHIQLMRSAFTNISDLGDGNTQATLEVEYRRVGKVYSAKDIKQQFTVIVKNPVVLDEIAECIGGGEGNGEATCSEIGGVWDGATSECDLTQPGCDQIGGVWQGTHCDLMPAACDDIGGVYNPTTAEPGFCDLCPAVGLGTREGTRCTGIAMTTGTTTDTTATDTDTDTGGTATATDTSGTTGTPTWGAPCCPHGIPCHFAAGRWCSGAKIDLNDGQCKCSNGCCPSGGSVPGDADCPKGACVLPCDWDYCSQSCTGDPSCSGGSFGF